jgi:hypothetical protein
MHVSWLELLVAVLLPDKSTCYSNPFNRAFSQGSQSTILRLSLPVFVLIQA